MMAALLDRVKAILLRPREEWRVIDAEPATVPSILTGYVLPLAAIPPVAMLIGGQLFGYSALGVTWRPPLLGAVGMAVAQYVLSIVALFLLAMLISYLAPSFGGHRDKVQAFKLAAYSSTAGWVAGAFTLIPGLSMLGLLGLYSLYLLYIGLPILTKSTQDKAATYTVVVIVSAAILFVIAGALAAPFGRIGAPDPADVSGTVTLPGVGSVDVGKLEEAGKQMEAAAKGDQVAVNPAALQAMLPAKLGRFYRTEIESSGVSAAAHASAHYQAGDDDIRIELTDMGSAAALAGLGAAFNVQSNRETETGYERTRTVDGRIVSEEWDKESRRGHYATTVASRFVVEAEGTVASMEELTGAVTAIDLGKLEALVKR